MRHTRPFAAVLLATSVLSGCETTVTSQPLSNVGSPFPRGVIYRLPVTALDIKATYALVACPSDRTDSPVVRISNASVSAATIPETDPQYAFLIDPKALTSWFKTVDDSKIELRDGMLKTVTYEAEDHTRDVVGKAIDTLLRFGTISVPGTPHLTARVAEKAGIECSEATKAALKTRDKLKQNVKAAKRKLADANAAYEADPTPKNKELVAIAMVNLTKAEAILGSLIAKSLQFTSATREIPRASKQCDADKCRLFTKIIVPPPELVEKWFEIHTQGRRDSTKFDNAKSALDSSLAVTLAGDGRTLAGNSPGDDAFDGVFYRVPANVTVSVYSGALNVPAAKDLLATASTNMFQFGPIAAIPIRNGIFQSNRYVVEFDEVGALKSFQYQEKKARVSEALGTLDEALSKANDSELNSIKAETALIEAETGRLDALKKLNDAKGALDDTTIP